MNRFLRSHRSLSIAFQTSCRLAALSTAILATTAAAKDPPSPPPAVHSLKELSSVLNENPKLIEKSQGDNDKIWKFSDKLILDPIELPVSKEQKNIFVWPDATNPPGALRREPEYPAGLLLAAGEHVSRLENRNVSGPDAIKFILNKENASAGKLTEESAILADAMLRPSMLVCSNKISDPVSPFWRDLVEPNQRKIQTTLRSTGYITCPENPGEKRGTCFVVGRDLVLTNRHVARSFCVSDDARGGPAPLLSAPTGNHTVTPRIDFGKFAADCSAAQTAFRVLEVAHIEPATGLDVALLRVEVRDTEGNKLPPALTLFGPQEQESDDKLLNQAVYLAGYPVLDVRESFTVQRKIFGDQFEVKRVSPGTLRKNSKANELLRHDCTTLGGNSGSPVCDFNTGKVIGLHFSGRMDDHDDNNYAIPAWRVLSIPAVAGILSADPGATPLTEHPADASHENDEKRQAGPKKVRPEVPKAKEAVFDPDAPLRVDGTQPEKPPAATEASAEPPLSIAAFDENGSPVDPASFKRILNAANKPADIFVMSHGWNNSAREAEDSYRRMIRRMATVAQQQSLLPEKYQSLIVGVRWPSKAWVDDAVSNADEAAGAADSAALVAAIYENFPRSRASDAQYSKDVMRTQDLLQTASPTADDWKDLRVILQRYAIQGDTIDEPNVFGAGETQPPATPTEEASFSPLDAFRVFTYWQMKARAGIVGRSGLRDLLEQLQRAYPNGRIHLFGHSFGAKVVLASLTARPLPRPVNTVVLLQPAISFWAFASSIPNTNEPGGYRSALDPARISGPVVLTYSQFDVPLTYFYPLASRVAGQTGERFEGTASPNKYSALGAVGAYRSGPKSFQIDIQRSGVAYKEFAPALWSVNGGISKDFINGHSDLDKDAIAWLMWSAVRPSFAK